MDTKENILLDKKKCRDKILSDISPPDQDEGKGIHKKYFTSSQRRREQRKKAAQAKKCVANDNSKNNLSTKVKLESSLLNNDSDIGRAKNIVKHCVSRKHCIGDRASDNKSPEHNTTNKSLPVDIKLPSLPLAENKRSKIESNKMDQLNKSRDEVKAAREEKKKLKQMAKTENKNKIEGNKSKTEIISQDIKTNKDVKCNVKTDPVSANHTNNVDNKTNTAVKESTQLKSNVQNDVNHKQQCESKVVENTLNKSISKNEVVIDNSNVEKSRDDIKAEREAKKLAKQMAKNKSKTKPGDANAVEEKLANMTLNSSSEGYNITKEEIDHKDAEKVPTINVDQLDNKQVDQESKESEKSKAALRAERRAKQEAQRAAKAVLQSVKEPKVQEKKKQEVKHLEKPKQTIVSDLKKSQSPEKTKTKNQQEQHKVKLFDHLYVQREAGFLESPIPLNSKDIHPAIVRLGVQYASHIVMGSNARCIALLNALKEVISDYTLPPNVEFSRGFEAHLKPSIKFLDSCRQPAVSMQNALKHIKWQLRHLPNKISEDDAKTKLQEAIDTYIYDQIEMAGKAISLAVSKKISDGDVILTYGCSSLIEKIISETAEEKRQQGKRFRVVIVAAHPWNEGRELLRRLTAKGVKCSLVMISALSFIMREINKVLLGAGALLANGYVMARAGTAQVAMVAHAHNVPVLVCCETHKFSERVQTDSIVYNEIGNPDDLINCDPSHKEGPLANWRTNNSLTLLNLTYDVTPPDLVTAVVTELAILPCTSVPVILRMKPSEFSV